MAQWLFENWKLVAFVLNSLFALGIWAMSKTYAKKGDLYELADRVKKVESTVSDLPTIKEMHQLDKNLIDVSGQLKAISPQIEDLKKITGLLMENELRGKQ